MRLASHRQREHSFSHKLEAVGNSTRPCPEHTSIGFASRQSDLAEQGDSKKDELGKKAQLTRALVVSSTAITFRDRRCQLGPIAQEPRRNPGARWQVAFSRLRGRPSLPSPLLAAAAATAKPRAHREHLLSYLHTHTWVSTSFVEIVFLSYVMRARPGHPNLQRHCTLFLVTVKWRVASNNNGPPAQALSPGLGSW